jgi:putative oxidoreductase
VVLIARTCVGPGQAAAAATSELAVGVGLAAGLLTLYAGAGVMALMLIATMTVTGSHRFLAERGGSEYDGALIANTGGAGAAGLFLLATRARPAVPAGTS